MSRVSHILVQAISKAFSISWVTTAQNNTKHNNLFYMAEATTIQITSYFSCSLFHTALMITIEASSGCISADPQDTSSSLLPFHKPNSILIPLPQPKWDQISLLSGVFFTVCLSSSDMEDTSWFTASSTVFGHVVMFTVYFVTNFTHIGF